MKKFAILPFVAIATLGLSACSSHSTTENVTVNETSTNAVDANLEAPAVDGNAIDNAADATLENGANTADALTNS
jgi:uncharacterized protein YcfL